MCRMLAYLGPPRPLADIVFAGPHSLLHQAWAPSEQRHGTVNADGFGVGWWRPDRRPEPAVYRTTRPIWADRTFESLAGVVDAGAVVAAVRSATPPNPVEESATAPFADGPWLFAHNGFLDGFWEGRGVELRRRLPPAREARIRSSCDSEVLFALVLARLDAGLPPAEAVAETIRELAPGNTGGLNVLLGDGHRLVATAWGNSLALRPPAPERPGFWVASEPTDDGPGWESIPDRTLVEISEEGVRGTPL